VRKEVAGFHDLHNFSGSLSSSVAKNQIAVVEKAPRNVPLVFSILFQLFKREENPMNLVDEPNYCLTSYQSVCS